MDALEGHQGPAAALLWLADGQLAAGGVQQVSVWRPGKARPRAQRPLHEPVVALGAMPDGALASVDEAGELCLWDPCSGKLRTQRLLEPAAGGTALVCAAFAAAGSRLAVVERLEPDGSFSWLPAFRVAIWDCARLERLTLLDDAAFPMRDHGSLRSIAVSADGALVAAGCVDVVYGSDGDWLGATSKVLVWDATATASRAYFELDSEYSGGHGMDALVAFAPDELYAASGGSVWSLVLPRERSVQDPGTACAWDVPALVERSPLALAVAADGSACAVLFEPYGSNPPHPQLVLLDRWLDRAGVLRLDRPRALSVAAERQRRRVAVGFEDGNVQVLGIDEAPLEWSALQWPPPSP